MGAIIIGIVLAVAPASLLSLVTLQRSVNANVVRYDARLGPDGLLDPEAPVDAYWILGARDGSREELGFLERRVYGATAVVAADRRSMEVVIRGVPDRPLSIRLAGQRTPASVEVEISGVRAVLDEVFVECGLMSIEFVRLRGHTAEGKRVEETLRR